ncbi:MAG TPA: carbon storage regulator [Candidatus Binatia bacterium]|nr:carbon storage regulator [Candidatus Binatia bacterium]
MLMLTRKPGDAIAIGPDIVVRVVAIEGQQVKLGIEAPREVKVGRAEAPAEPRKK